MPRLNLRAGSSRLCLRSQFDGSGSFGRTLLNPASDMTWKGMYRLAPNGSNVAGGPGGTGNCGCPLTIRYVSGQRRLLTVLYASNDSSACTLGDVVEYALPFASSYYQGSSPLSSTALTETRRWGGNWHLIRDTPAWQDLPDGTNVGGLYWDEAQGVLWYTAYGYYYAHGMPFLGASQLLDAADTGRGGDYCQVGTRSGPWWYRNGSPSDTTLLYWKMVSNAIISVPSYARTNLGGCSVLFGGAAGSVSTVGHLGPGLHGRASLPPLADAPNTVIPLGTRFADFSPDALANAGLGEPARYCPRDTNYVGALSTSPSNFQADSGFYSPTAGVGHWQMSQDQVNGWAWVDTGTKHGLILMGRTVRGGTWYGTNPLTDSPSGPEGFYCPAGLGPYTDITATHPGGGNQTYAEIYAGAIRVYDPTQLAEVVAGTRSPYANGMRPVDSAQLDWHSQWPNIPVSQVEALNGFSGSRLIAHGYLCNTAVWDGVNNELIWGQPVTTGSGTSQPTIQIFGVS